MGIEKIKEILEIYKAEIEKKYSVSSVGVFGSYVRNEQNKGSDIDILVEFKDKMSLLKFVALENYLSEILGIKVDLVMKDALKPRIGKHILEEVIML